MSMPILSSVFMPFSPLHVSNMTKPLRNAADLAHFRIAISFMSSLLIS